MFNYEPTLIKGNQFADHRGSVSFVNNFHFPNVKRFYTIHHPEREIVRAWQGHKIEEKFFYVTQGAFVIAYVAINDWGNPSKDLVPEYLVLRTVEPAVLYLPPGYANGIKAIENNSTLISFSTLLLADAQQDDYRFDTGNWLDWSQF